MKQLFTILFALCVGSTLSAQDRVEWRFDRTGHYSKETGLLKSWPPKGPELLWHFEGLGDGYTSISIDHNKIFVTGITDGKGYLYVLNLQGKLLNKVDFGKEWDSDGYIGTRSTVIPNDGKLYVVNGNAELFCFDENSLKLLWKKDYIKEYAAENTKHGWHGPPLIVGEKLIIAPGGKMHNVVALNKNTGKTIWTSKGADVMSGYGVPIYIGDQSVPQIAIMMSHFIIGLDAATGQMLWSHPHTNRFGEHPNTPIYSNGLLFGMSSYGKGSVMLQLTDGGKQVKKVYDLPQIGHQMGHVLKFGNYVYGSGQRTTWYCADWKTGKIMYESKDLAAGNIISADGMLYILSDKGEMALVKPNSQKLDLVSKFSVTLGTGPFWTHPVIYNGVLYIRHGDALMAYKIK
ncbi:MAG: PQQ-like beta-propeller repeat protein [Bacteroidales bacterium]|nr:PQQ-like beta-propeller repeat protein [Bacteroidales bacterium]